MSGKVLESALGNLEYLMAALTLLGVMWLCYKQAGLQLSVSSAAAAGAAAGASAAQGFDDLDRGALRFAERSHPGARSGFAGSKNMDGPEFWSNATEMDQLAGLAMDQDPEVSKKDKKEGLEDDAYRRVRRAGMENKLGAALLGANASL